MIFHIKERTKPKVGDTKVATRFAFLPMKVNSNTIIWLQRYYIQYQLCDRRYFDYCGYVCVDKYWTEIDRWIEAKGVIK
jgi:hypothetical protein